MGEAAGGAAADSSPPVGPATFGQVFAVLEFRPLFGAHLLSTIGDELARVALTVLVYQRTDSALLAAVAFGTSYLPWLVGGPVLATLADRLPRHRVLVACDVARAVLVALMALPGLPLPVLLGLLLAVSLCAPPFEAARSALMADVLEGDRYAVATSLTGISLQLSQLVGFLLGGALLVTLAPEAALLLDAATFAVSAVWLARGLRARPAPAPAPPGGRPSLWRDSAGGLRLVARRPRLLAIVGLLWVAGAFVNAPEGIATPLTGQLQVAPSATGLLLAAGPAGTVVGALLVGRLCPPHLRARLLAPLVVLSLGSVLLAGLVPGRLAPGTPAFTLVLGLFFLAGVGGACSIPLNVAFVQAVPAAYRGRAFGVAVAGLSGAQGLGVVLAGVGAEVLAPGTVVALCGALGMLAVAGPLAALGRLLPAGPGGAPGPGPGPVGAPAPPAAGAGGRSGP